MADKSSQESVDIQAIHRAAARIRASQPEAPVLTSDYIAELLTQLALNNWELRYGASESVTFAVGDRVRLKRAWSPDLTGKVGFIACRADSGSPYTWVVNSLPASEFWWGAAVNEDQIEHVEGRR